MPHFVVVFLTQASAVAMGGLLVWGFIELIGLNHCIAGETGLCMADTFLAGMMSLSAFITFAFSLILFKAYMD